MSASTVYDVITRYRTEDQASGPMRSYQRAADDVSRSNLRAQASFGAMGVSISTLLRVMGPLSAGLTLVGAGLKVFQSIKDMREGAISMAAQFNQVLEFDSDPSRNFMENLALSKSFMKDIAADAAKLPGEIVDFQRAAGMASFSVLAGGGDLAMLRRMVGNLSIAAPAAGQNLGDASGQMFRILSGQASVGDNPLFAFLKPMLGGGNFNEMTLPERVAKLDEVLQRFAGNPALRTEIMQTFSTQWSTLMENLFGATSVLGELGQNPFGDLVSSLADLNTWLSDHRDDLMFLGNIFGGGNTDRAIRDALLGPDVDESGFFGRMAGKAFDAFTRSVDEGQREELLQRATEREYLRRGGEFKFSPNPFDRLPQDDALFDRILGEKRRELLGSEFDVATHAQLESLGFLQIGKNPRRKTTPALTGDTVTNYVTIKVDLKSDDSPEAVAVKMGKAFERMTRHPTRATRAAAITPRARTIN